MVKIENIFVFKTTKNYKISNRIAFCFAAICLLFTFAHAAFSQASDAKLTELRKQFALDYLKPASHFALANYYLEKNDKLTAFYILEYARRYRFPEKDFNAEFIKVFGDNSPEPSAQAKKAFEEGYRLLKLDKLDEAEASLVKAAKLAPKSAFVQGWVGRFFFKVRQNSAQALPYYYNAYFLDPHAYETEFVESRIQNITNSDADLRFAELKKAGQTLAAITTDENPLIVGKAIEEMAQKWNKDYSEALLKCLNSDETSVRWGAFATLYKNADSSFNETLTALLKDQDDRKRGLAAYALAERRKEKRFEILKKMLADKAELIRFDAVSALVMMNDEIAVEMLKEHLKTESSVRLRAMLAQNFQQK